MLNSGDHSSPLRAAGHFIAIETKVYFAPATLLFRLIKRLGKQSASAIAVYSAQQRRKTAAD